MELLSDFLMFGRIIATQLNTKSLRKIHRYLRSSVSFTKKSFKDSSDLRYVLKWVIYLFYIIFYDQKITFSAMGLMKETFCAKYYLEELKEITLTHYLVTKDVFYLNICP